MLKLLFFILLSLTCFSQTKKDALFYFREGEAAMDDQSYEAALKFFNQCLAINPKFFEVYFYRAQVRQNLSDVQGALTDLNIYLEAKPQSNEAIFSRALIRYQLKQWAFAREDFLALLKAPPGETQSVFYSVDSESDTHITTIQTNMTPLLLNYLGLVDTKLKNYKRATNYLDSAIKLDSKNVEFFINRGWCYQEMFDTLRAMDDYQRALSINPQSSIARYNIAVLSAKKGNLKQVENLLTKAIINDSENANYFTARAINYTAQGLLTNALDDYNFSLHWDSVNADVWLKRAMIKQMLKDYNGALADVTQSIKLKDDNEKTWLERGDLMMRLERIKEAVEDYTIAITLQPNFGKAYINRAVAYQRLSNSTKACEDILIAKNLNMSIDELFKTSVCK